jgi:hypothetical protein
MMPLLPTFMVMILKVELLKFIIIVEALFL